MIISQLHEESVKLLTLWPPFHNMEQAPKRYGPKAGNNHPFPDSKEFWNH